MAQMIPRSLALYQHTLSEEKVFNALKKQLDNRIMVFFSVSWISIINGIKQESECDFLIFDPMYGFLACEVKGGNNIRKDENGDWFLIETNEERKLKRSPIEQAEESARYFKSLYESEYHFGFRGIYGSISIFPNFIINDPTLLDNRPKELILDYSDMNNLSAAITKAFIIWKRKMSIIGFTPDQKKNFVNLINKRIAISAAAGALISNKEKELEEINRVQDNYIYLLKDYKQAFISGGAGTGKTWIAIKFAKKLLEEGKTVLMTCFNDKLIDLFKNEIGNYNNFKAISFNDILVQDGCDLELFNYPSKLFDEYNFDEITKYDAIIVDEAQDFDKYYALITRMHLKNENDSYLYVFYDKTQNLYNRDFKDGFMINNPPFYLRENLRNTASIYNWAKKNTLLGTDVLTNQIIGPIPTVTKFNDIQELNDMLENVLIELIDKEYVNKDFITILVPSNLIDLYYEREIGKWILTSTFSNKSIKVESVDKFKGLESNVIIYIHNANSTKETDYVAYTRAKFYLYDFIIK